MGETRTRVCPVPRRIKQYNLSLQLQQRRTELSLWHMRLRRLLLLATRIYSPCSATSTKIYNSTIMNSYFITFINPLITGQVLNGNWIYASGSNILGAEVGATGTGRAIETSSTFAAAKALWQINVILMSVSQPELICSGPLSAFKSVAARAPNSLRRCFPASPFKPICHCERLPGFTCGFRVSSCVSLLPPLVSCVFQWLCALLGTAAISLSLSLSQCLEWAMWKLGESNRRSLR